MSIFRVLHPIRTVFGEILRISSSWVRIRENTDQKTPECGHFFCSASETNFSKFIYVARKTTIKITDDPLHEICQNVGFLWHIFSRIRAKSYILFSYGKIQLRKNLYSGKFYTMLNKLFSSKEKRLACFILKTFQANDPLRFKNFWYSAATPYNQILSFLKR